MPFTVKRTIKVGSVVPPEQFLINNNLESYSVQSPLAIATFRDIVSDGVWTGGAQSNMTYLSLTDQGATYGKCITWYSPINTMGTAYGIAIGTIPIAGSPDWAAVDYWVRFRNGFEYTAGGKLPGLGGVCPSRISAAPSGGTPSPYGWSGRFMWRGGPGSGGGGNISGDGEISSYFYAPYQPSNAYGVDRVTGIGFGRGTTAGISNGQWRRIRQVYKMNTSYVDSTSTATPAIGTTHEANGVHEIWIDTLDGNGLVRRYFTDTEVFRYYNDCHVNRVVWSQFRGGSDPEVWDSDTADGYVDIANFQISTLAA